MNPSKTEKQNSLSVLKCLIKSDLDNVLTLLWESKNVVI